MKLKKGITFLLGLLIIAALSNCDCASGRENPNDPGGDNYEPRQVDPPTISPGSQTFSAIPFSVTITVPAGATVIYTLDNTEPSMTNGTQVTASKTFTISETTIIQAKSCMEYYNDSSIVTTTYTYVPPTVTGISVTPNGLTMTKGATQQLTVTANYSDSSTTDKTAASSFASNSDSIASVSATGLVTANGPGIATITATYSVDGTDYTANSTITINKALTSFTISPTSDTINNLTTLQFSASATYDDGQPASDVTASTAWSVNCTAPGDASITPSGGLMTAAKGGACTVTATFGAEVQTASVTINPVWQVVGNAAFSGGTVSYSSLFLYNDVPYVAIGNGSGTLEVWKLNAGTNLWTDISPTTPPSATYVSLAVVNDGGTVKPHLAFYNTTAGYQGLAHWIDNDTGTWGTQNNQLNGMNQITYIDIALLGTSPYIIGADNANSGRAKVWVDDATEVGPSTGFPTGVNSTSYTSIITTASQPIAAFRYEDGSNGCHVNKYNSTDWVNMDDSATSTQITADNDVLGTKIQVDSSGVPVVAYQKSDNTIVVYKWASGSTWNAVGSSAGNSVGTSTVYTGFTLDNDIPYVAYWDSDNSNTLNVKYFTTSWTTKCAVGAGTTMPANANGGSFDLKVYNGVPYVLAVDYTNSSKATVFKCE